MAITQIFKDLRAFERRKNKFINGCTPAFAEKHHINLDRDDGNIGCWNSVRLKFCTRCYYCTDCTYAIGCIKCHGLEEAENLKAVGEPRVIPTRLVLIDDDEIPAINRNTTNLNFYKLRKNYQNYNDADKKENAEIAFTTKFSLHELNIRFAYIQLLKISLLKADGYERFMSNRSEYELFKALFDQNCAIIHRDDEHEYIEIYSGDLRLNENFMTYFCSLKYLHEIKSVAKPGAYKIVLNQMISECKKEIKEVNYMLEHFCNEFEDTHCYYLDGEVITDRINDLEYIFNSGIAKEKGNSWSDLKSGADIVFFRNDDEPDLPLCLREI